jgi:hypothetical protein
MSKKILMGFAALLLFLGGAVAQNMKVTGKVTSEKGEPIAGASIVEKNSKSGVSAAPDGSFTISVKKGAKVVVSAVGYETREVSSSATMMIQLGLDSKTLTDIVVTGVGVAETRKP